MTKWTWLHIIFVQFDQKMLIYEFNFFFSFVVAVMNFLNWMEHFYITEDVKKIILLENLNSLN